MDIDINSLDRQWNDIDRAVRYIQKVVTLITSIAEKYLKITLGTG